MKKNLTILPLLIFIFFCQSLEAYIENRNLFPIGDRECFLANSSQAVLESSGASFFNPGLLGSISTSRISASVTTLAEFTTQVPSFANYDGVDLDFKNSGTLTIPNSLMSVFNHREDGFVAAFSVFVPELIQLRNVTSFETPNSSIDVIHFFDTEDLWFGPSYALALGANIDIGLSLFFLRHRAAHQNNTVIFKKNTPANTIQIQAQSTQYEKLETLGFILKSGIWWHPQTNFNLGLSIALPFSKYNGETSIYQLKTTNGTSAIVPLQKMDFDYTIPFDFIFGIGLGLTDNLHLYADVGYQVATSYQPYPIFPQYITTRDALRSSAGLEWEFYENWDFLAGYMNNPSSIDLESTFVQSREDFFGYTLGVFHSQGPARIGIGGFSYSSNGQNIVIGTSQRQAEFHSQLNGILISSIFLY